MSLNTLIDQEYIGNLNTLLKVLEQYIFRWKNSFTAEERLVVEAEAIVLFEQLLDKNLDTEFISWFNHPVYEEWQKQIEGNKYNVYKFNTKIVE